MSKKEKLQGKRGSGPPVAPTIAPSKAPQWTRERIEALVEKDLANLRSNAEKRGEEEIVNLCVLVQTERRTAQRTSLRHRKQEISKKPGSRGGAGGDTETREALGRELSEQHDLSEATAAAHSTGWGAI